MSDLVNCPDCFGNGRTEQGCGICGGTGRQSCSECSGGGHTYNGRCPVCRGSGSDNSCDGCAGRGHELIRCALCKGAGKVTYTDFQNITARREQKAVQRDIAQRKQAEEDQKRREAEAIAKAERWAAESLKQKEQEEARKQEAATAAASVTAERQRLIENRLCFVCGVKMSRFDRQDKTGTKHLACWLGELSDIQLHEWRNSQGLCGYCGEKVKLWQNTSIMSSKNHEGCAKKYGRGSVKPR